MSMRVDRVQLKLGGIRALKRSPEVTGDVARRAQRVAARANALAGAQVFEVKVKPAPTSARAFVQPVRDKQLSARAARAQAKDRVLNRSLDAAS